jgi:hypothetical protein
MGRCDGCDSDNRNAKNDGAILDTLDATRIERKSGDVKKEEGGKQGGWRVKDLLCTTFEA